MEIEFKSTTREGRSYQEFIEQHIGHRIHIIGPVADEGCAIVVRFCGSCVITALMAGKIAFPIHISHRDATDPLTQAPTHE